MTDPLRSDVDEGSRSMPTKCRVQIESTMAELRQALTNASRLSAPAPADERKSVEADVCLASRSAYFDFYTWVVLHGEIDDDAAAELDALFRNALAVIQAGQFKDSVQERYDEFRDLCERVREGRSHTETSSSMERETEPTAFV